jgi:hypothetical protein
MLPIVIGCCGGLGFLFALIPALVREPPGLALGGFALLTACVHIINAQKDGRSLRNAFLQVVFWGFLAFGLAYGCTWYFTVYLASQPNIFRVHLGSPTATPHR